MRRQRLLDFTCLLRGSMIHHLIVIKLLECKKFYLKRVKFYLDMEQVSNGFGHIWIVLSFPLFLTPISLSTKFTIPYTFYTVLTSTQSLTLSLIYYQWGPVDEERPLIEGQRSSIQGVDRPLDLIDVGLMCRVKEPIEDI